MDDIPRESQMDCPKDNAARGTDMSQPNACATIPTNDRMLRYKRLPYPVFTDTVFVGTASKQGNKCAQAYATLFGWS
jgi:hypothetical protein